MPYQFGPQEAITYLTQQGMPGHVAAGFAGNFGAESGFDAGINEINPLVEGSRGGYGLYQLTGPRRKQYESWVQENERGLDDPYAQLDFMMHELGTTEKGAYDRIMKSKNVDEAAKAVSEKFLRPGIPHLDKRMNLAREYAGLDPMAAGPTNERARAGLPLQTRPPEKPQMPSFYEDEYADNWLGRVQQNKDTMRAGLGDKLGLDAKQMGSMGKGLQGLGGFISQGGFG